MDLIASLKGPKQRQQVRQQARSCGDAQEPSVACSLILSSASVDSAKTLQTTCPF